MSRPDAVFASLGDGHATGQLSLSRLTKVLRQRDAPHRTIVGARKFGKFVCVRVRVRVCSCVRACMRA